MATPRIIPIFCFYLCLKETYCCKPIRPIELDQFRLIEPDCCKPIRPIEQDQFRLIFLKNVILEKIRLKIFLRVVFNYSLQHNRLMSVFRDFCV